MLSRSSKDAKYDSLFYFLIIVTLEDRYQQNKGELCVYVRHENKTNRSKTWLTFAATRLIWGIVSSVVIDGDLSIHTHIHTHAHT